MFLKVLLISFLWVKSCTAITDKLGIFAKSKEECLWLSRLLQLSFGIYDFSHVKSSVIDDQMQFSKPNVRLRDLDDIKE